MGSMDNGMGKGGKPDAGNGREDMSGMPNMGERPSALKSATGILLSVSVGVLLSGLLFAGFYRRRRKRIF